MVLNLLVNVFFILFFAARQILLVFRRIYNRVVDWLKRKFNSIWPS